MSLHQEFDKLGQFDAYTYASNYHLPKLDYSAIYKRQYKVTEILINAQVTYISKDISISIKSILISTNNLIGAVSKLFMQILGRRKT